MSDYFSPSARLLQPRTLSVPSNKPESQTTDVPVRSQEYQN